MSTASTASLIDALRQYRLLEAAQLEEVAASLQARFFDPKTLAKELVQRDWLTSFQANLLLEGRGQELVLGTYTLLAKLGEGGMGQVFKARSRKLGRIVALKLIRPEKLNSANAVRRFQREVRAVAQLNHPHVVRAIDADTVGDALLLVMEFVDGTNFSKLVKNSGPLPILDACEFIRQAALGLQHAHEKGLVHRDIKPHNLLLTRDGVVKILDMGLARLTTPDEHKSSVMTQEGGFIGTPDYIAPEQAINSHTADIRADIYSLGCTFYYLLAGQVPFPEGFLTEKLLQHQFKEPLPLEQQRPDVPPVVAKIVGTMMAKKPANRYQTPAEVALALAALSVPRRHSLETGAADEVTTESCHAITPGEPSADSVSSALQHMARVGIGPKSRVLTQPITAPKRKRRWPLYFAAGAVLLTVSLAVILFFQLQQPEDTDKNKPVPEIPTWTVLDVDSFTSIGGAEFTKQSDGSILVSGPNPSTDRYTITAKTKLKDITGVRLEVLADPSLSANGPGRSENGNFVLSGFWVSVARAGDAPEKANVVTLQNPLATFSQDNYPIAATIDDDPRSGWAVSPQFGKNHIAVFEFEKKVGHAGGTLLVFTLGQNYGGSHNIGRLRLSVTTKPPPVLPFPDSPKLDGEAVYLSDLPETDVKVEQNWFFKNGRGPAEGFIMVNNIPSAKGLFVHPPSSSFSLVGYDLKEHYEKFETTAAINDTGKSASPLTFTVLGDARTLWTSKPLRQAGQIDECKIDVSGVKRLELRVDCPGANTRSHAVWLDPRLLKAKRKL